MKIQNVSRLNAALVLTAFLLLVVSSFRILDIQTSIDESERIRLLAMRQADDLQHFTDELARMGQTYVVTGDPVYKTYFYEIIAIRDGRQERPDNYSRAYWDRTLAQGKPEARSGMARPVAEMIAEAGYSQNEAAHFQEALLRGDALVKLNEEAFRLIEGSGGVARSPLEARLLLNTIGYHRAKAAVTDPLQRATEAVEQRTAATHEALVAEQRRVVLFTLLVALTGFVGSMAIASMTNRRLLRPTLSLLKQTASIREGDYQARVDEAGFSDDLAPLGQAFNRMADAIAAEIYARTESERFARSTIDALSAHLCVIDERGVILGVNDAWRRFARENGSDANTVSEGTNYIDLCQGACGANAEEAHPFAQGLRELLAGTRTYFSMEYPCHSPTEQRWFLARATRFPGDGPIRVVVVHENVTMLKLAEAAARHSEQRLSGIIETAMDAIVSVDDRHVITLFNPAAEVMFGYRNDEVLGKPLEVLLPQRFRSGHHERIDKFARGAEIRRYVGEAGRIIGARKSGEEFLAEATLSRFTHEGATVFTVFLRDVTDRVRSEEQLRLWSTVMNASHEGIVITDSEEKIIAVNPAFTRITGYSGDESCGQTPRILASRRQNPDFYDNMRRQLKFAGHWQGEIWNRRKNGEVYPEWLAISAVNAPDGRVTHYIGIFADISNNKAAEDRIRFLSYHDALTALPKRELLRDRTEQAIVHAAHAGSLVALLFVDIDRFKTINDSLGHEVGDRVLKTVAKRLRDCTGPEVTIARQSGDEFVILLTGLENEAAAATLAQEVADHFNSPIECENAQLSVSVSIGIALFPEDANGFEALLKKAEGAMYAAKDAGRNTYRFFTGNMNVDSTQRLRLQTRMHDALVDHEFTLHYQPQIEISTGHVIGVEALLRWRDEREGLIAPGTFIPIAEDTGMIVPIGNWVLEEACRQARSWHDAGLHQLSMAVNLSALQFKRGDIEKHVEEALMASGLDPQYLELEITESIMIREPQVVLATLHRLKSLGVKLSIDDFGTGYSSLSYLREFSVDKLKIDQSFVRDLVDDADDAAIVHAIIQMARSLKMRTIAEGVETETALNRLRLFHCDEVQGFHFSKPLPPEECLAYLREHA